MPGCQALSSQEFLSGPSVCCADLGSQVWLLGSGRGGRGAGDLILQGPQGSPMLMVVAESGSLQPRALPGMGPGPLSPRPPSSTGPTVGLSGGILRGLHCLVQPGARLGPGETLFPVLPPHSLGFVRLGAAGGPSQVCVHLGSKCKACACPDSLASLTICLPPDPAGPCLDAFACLVFSVSDLE